MTATSITAGNITDTRLNESLCGIMRDGVTAIPTAQLLANATAAVNSFFDIYGAVINSLSDESARRGKTLATFSGAGWKSGNQTIAGISNYSVILVEYGFSGVYRYVATATKINNAFGHLEMAGTAAAVFGFQLSGNVCSPLSLNTLLGQTGLPAIGTRISYYLHDDPVSFGDIGVGITKIIGLI